MKIGILTYHSSHNYGAFLQAYSLAAFLNKQMGIDAEIIDYSLKKAEDVNRNLVVFSYKHLKRWWILRNRYIVFQDSRKLNPYISAQHLISDDIKEFKEYIDSQNYDSIITGSDEIWKLDGYRGFPNAYWLPEINNIIKIAYAPSSRTELEKIDAATRMLVNKYLASYSYIGVRDIATKDMLDTITDKKYDIHINCDPTFLFDFNVDKLEARNMLSKHYKKDFNKKTIALMCGVPELANEIIKKYGKRYNIICLYEYYKRSCKCKRIPNPFEWMEIIAGCDGLITTFYHGLVFSIKNRTPFISIENRELDDSSYSKSFDLLKRNHLDEHFYLLKKQNIDGCMRRVDKFINNVENGKYYIDYSLIETNEKLLSDTFIDFLKDKFK